MRLLFAVMLSAAVTAPRPMLWEPSPGASHLRSAAPRATTGWLGLYCSEGCSLRPAKLEYVADKRFDDLLYAATKPEGAVFVFRDVPGLREGPVTRIDMTTPLDRRQALPLVLGGERYEIRVTAANDYLEKAVVTVHHEGASQEIFRMPEFVDEAHIDILFAGDLDRDGKLDLITNMSWKYSLHPLQLFLSSAARAGELTREVANFERSSC
jgi:hypothetical protein